MKNIIKTLLPALIFLLISVQIQAKSKKVSLGKFGKVYVAKEFSDFKLTDTKKYDDAALGVAFTYEDQKAPMVKLDYYIYPVYQNIPVEHIMAYEYQNIVMGVKHYAEQDEGLFSVLNSDIVELNNSPFIQSTMHIEKMDSIYISEFFLTSKKGQLLKIRATYPMMESKSNNLRNRVRQFTQEVFENTKFKTKYKPSRSINVSEMVVSDKNAMRFGLAYSAGVIANIDESLIDRFEDFEKIYSTSLEILSELKEKNPQQSTEDNHINLSKIKEAGFLREFIWNAFSRSYWKEPSKLKLDEFKSWISEMDSSEFLVRPDGFDVLLNLSK